MLNKKKRKNTRTYFFVSSRSSHSSVSTVVDITVGEVVILLRPNCVDRAEEEEE